MIDKLRKRLITTTLIAAAIILTAAVIVTLFVSNRYITAERNRRFAAALSYDEHTAEIPFEDNALFSDLCLVVYDLNTDKIVAYHHRENNDWDMDFIASAAHTIAHSRKKSGLLAMRVNFAKQQDGPLVKIAFYDFSQRSNNVFWYFGSILCAAVLCMGAFLILSFSLAKTALEPIEQSWKSQKQFIADASHELKTPLSVIMANTEMLAMHGGETVESQMKWIENTRAEAKSMAELVADLLTLAKSDDGLRVQLDELNLSDCVNSVTLGCEALMYESGHKFAYEIESDLEILGNFGQIKQLVTILLDNANKYCLDNGDIRLALDGNVRTARLTVSNDCEPLSDEQLSHLFDRFYTVDPSRNKTHGGNGLGLSIAQMICQNHGGSISAGYADGRVTFTVLLPLKKHRKSVENKK